MPSAGGRHSALQVLVVAWIILLGRKIDEPAVSGPRPRFDLTGAVLIPKGSVSPVWLWIAIGAV